MSREVCKHGKLFFNYCEECEQLENYDASTMWQAYRKQQCEIQQLKEQLKSAREVIEFYGDEKSQVAPIYEPSGKPGADFTKPYRMDEGKRARQWLKDNEIK